MYIKRGVDQMEILQDAFVDSLKLLPVLFLIYLLIEYLEHKNNNLLHHMFMQSEKSGPFLGGLFGCLPQCGFSVIGSELYARRAVSLGTLLAIFISTSDEAIPILLAEPGMFKAMFKLIGVKLVIAIVFGFLTDALWRRKISRSRTCEHEHSEHMHFHGNCEDCHDGIFKAAVIHSLKIFTFIFIISLVLGFFMEYSAESFGFLNNHTAIQPFVSPLIGLVPNCAASVALTELYVNGGISFAALTGGLCSGAGVGLIVLFRLNKNLKENLTITALMYAVGVISGLALQAAGF